MAEIWWRNARDLDEAMRYPELEALREHLFLQGRSFIDLACSTLFFAQEQEVLEIGDSAAPPPA